MSVENGANGEVHYPMRRDLFQFDSEVASIFASMAPRSIPLYNEVHRLHVSMLSPVLEKEGCVVADIGSSTGRCWQEIYRQLGEGSPDTIFSVDASQPMLDMQKPESAKNRDYRHFCWDITKAPDLPEPADVMFCYYVVQFIPNEHKRLAYRWMHRNLKEDGVLVLGQKDDFGSCLGEIFAAEYYKFRRDNGYSQDEIDCKTAALKNSMWPIHFSDTREVLLGLKMSPVVETTRWLQFSTLMAWKRGRYG